MEIYRKWIEFIALGMEALAVAVIVIAFLSASVSFLVHFGQRAANAYESYKVFLGRSLLLGLEFLVAADVIRTVALEPTIQNIVILGVLVFIRTFLSWSLVVEIEGRWPWRSAEGEKSVKREVTP